jgi:hypothetical protein
MNRIDAETADKIRQIMMLCRSRGQDPVTVLDTAGFLRHQAVRQQDAVNLLDQGIIPGVKALRVPPEVKTPLDMKRVILDALEGLRNELQATK